MALRLGTLTPSKLYIGATEVTKAFLGTTEVYSSAQPWTPAALGSALALWLDAADSSTITLNGSTVSQWNDKSGNGRHVSQATAASQPTYTPNGLNGKPTLIFDGVNDHLFRTQSFGLSQPLTIVSMQSFTNSAASLNYMLDNQSRLVVGSRFGISGGNAELGLYANTWIYAQNPVNSGVAFSISAVANGASSQLLANGATIATGNPGGVGITTNFVIGNAFDRSSAPWGGRSSEVVILSGNNADHRQRLEGYLAWKWGTEANLPANHPFRNSPPTV